jgi:hypothetical protein
VCPSDHVSQLDASSQKMEAAGIAPASREALVTASTCVAGHLRVSLEAPIGRVPFSLSRHEFNPSRNRRLGSSDPALASPAASRGRKRGARPLLFFRQRDGVQHCCWQVTFGRLLTRPADQPRHATSHFSHPVDPGSPPKLPKTNCGRPYGPAGIIISRANGSSRRSTCAHSR